MKEGGREDEMEGGSSSQVVLVHEDEKSIKCQKTDHTP